MLLVASYFHRTSDTGLMATYGRLSMRHGVVDTAQRRDTRNERSTGSKGESTAGTRR